jgi:hypothetical protein
LVLFFSHFLVLDQHVHAGVNEWLTIRNLDRDFFRWLPVCRCERRTGSGNPTRPGVMGAINGDIGATRRFAAAVFFLPHRCGSKEDATSSPCWRRIYPFFDGHSLKRLRPVYSKKRIPLQLE